MSMPLLEAEVTLPADDGLPGLLHLFDSHRVWQTLCECFGQRRFLWFFSHLEMRLSNGAVDGM